MSYDRALQKAMWYCSFQERCQQDLEKRFLAWGLEKSNWDKLIDVLIDDNYYNEFIGCKINSTHLKFKLDEILPEDQILPEE